MAATADGTVPFLDLRAVPPLGLGSMPFEATEVELSEGSLLALYTGQVGTCQLPQDPAVARARKAVDEQLADWGLEETAFATELIVSELVTNPIRCGRTPIQPSETPR